MKKLKVSDDVSSVTVGGVEYKASNGTVTVSNDDHARELELWHGLCTPEEHARRQREAAQKRRDEEAAAHAATERERQGRIAAAQAFLESNGLAVVPAKK